MKEYHLKEGPFIKDKKTIDKVGLCLLISLVPIVLFTFYKNGIIPYVNGKTNILGLFYPLIFVLLSTFVTFITESLYYKFYFKKDIKTSMIKALKNYAIFPGLFLALVLPINTPLEILILGGIIASLVGKLIFGGFGNNIFNPALIGALFILTAYSLTISNSGGYLNSYEVDTISQSTPLSNVVTGIGSYDTLVKPYGSLSDFFIGTIPGAVGETSFLLCLIAFIFLTVTKSIKWVIPVFYIATVFIMTFIIGSINDLGIWYPLFQIFSGGLMFGAVFMATDPVTSPVTKPGQIIYGLMLGILTVTFRYLTVYPEGVLTSILTMNMFVFIIDKIGVKIKFSKKWLILPLSIILILGLSISISVGFSYQKTSEVDPNYKIISKDQNDNQTIYMVSEKGYGGNIEARITFEDGKILEILIVNQNESFFQKIVDADYINKLVSSDDVANIDTVSGATVSSTALKKMVINTWNDYKGDNNE